MANKKAEPAQTSPDAFRWDKFIIELASKVGVMPTILLTLLGVFVLKGTKEQHEEFINKYVLLKVGNESCGYSYFIIICLILIVVAQYLYNKGKLKLNKERIDELATERTKLQEILFEKNKRLSSSKK